MPKAFFKMSRCRVMNSSSRRSRAISSALVGSLNLKAPGPVCSPIQTSLLQRFKLQTETPSSWLNCWALRSPDFNIATASRLNSSSNRRPFLFVPLFSFFSTVLALNYEHSRLSATSGTPHFRDLRQGLEHKAVLLLESSRSEPNEEAVRKRLNKQRDHLFTFLDHDGVDATNNLAERQLRPAVIARKISCGNKTQKGARTWQILTSLAATCAQRATSFIAEIARAAPLQGR